ncbi:hypothetical protein ACFL59_15735, partial [Planctomycetota bacterium]
LAEKAKSSFELARTHKETLARQIEDARRPFELAKARQEELGRHIEELDKRIAEAQRPFELARARQEELARQQPEVGKRADTARTQQDGLLVRLPAPDEGPPGWPSPGSFSCYETRDVQISGRKAIQIVGLKARAPMCALLRLEVDDIVISVNGIPLSRSSARKVYDRLKDKSEFRVEIERQGSRVVLRYQRPVVRK